MTPEEVLASVDHINIPYGKLLSLYGISIYTDIKNSCVYYIGPYDSGRIKVLEKMSGYKYIGLSKEEFTQRYSEYI